ncbi:hypothetical protein ACLBSN_32750, partial [Klebsiella pneumoniae]
MLYNLSSGLNGPSIPSFLGIIYVIKTVRIAEMIVMYVAFSFEEVSASLLIIDWILLSVAILASFLS